MGNETDDQTTKIYMINASMIGAQLSLGGAECICHVIGVARHCPLSTDH